MLIELVEGFFVCPKQVVVVKVTGEEECALFTSGQSAVDGGFHLPYPADEIAQQVNDAEDEEDDDEDKDEGEEEDDD